MSTRAEQQVARLGAVDALRGLIVVLMALDHASNFVARPVRIGEMWAGDYPSYDAALPFVVRWVTHLCAPGFFLLMGVSLALFAERRRELGWSEGQITRYLAVRGGVLVLLQQVPVNLAWALGPAPHGVGPGGGGEIWIYLGVLWGLGTAMALAAVLLRLPTRTLVLLGLFVTLAIPVFLPDASQGAVQHHPLLRMVLVPGQTGPLMVRYPTLPWMGVVLLGVVLGRQARRPHAAREAIGLGLVLLAAFVAIRLTGSWGNLRPVQPGWIGVLNATKYPPSLAFQCMTLGVDLTLLGAFAAVWKQPSEMHPLMVFGRSALFFYVVHLYLYAAMGLALAPTGIVPMLPLWLLGLAVLYPMCRYYAAFKQEKSPDSLWRLL